MPNLLQPNRVVSPVVDVVDPMLKIIFYYYSNPRIPNKAILPPPEIEGGCPSWIQMGGTQPGVARTKAHLLSQLPG